MVDNSLVTSHLAHTAQAAHDRIIFIHADSASLSNLCEIWACNFDEKKSTEMVRKS